MRHEEQLKELLRPLGVYDLEAPINAASLGAKGAALDRAAAELEELGRESILATAESWGLESWGGLLELSPAGGQDLRAAIWALLRIGSGAATLPAIRDTLSGCGIRVEVEETGPGRVQVSFPDVVGVPPGFSRLRDNIEKILPAHVLVKYVFRYLTWGELEARSWDFAHVGGMTWREVAMSV